MSHRTLLPGRSYRFLYPSINFGCLTSGMDERRILVGQVRDTENEQLDEETLSSNPFVKRGRWLVTGIDLEKNEVRSFYVESMIAVMEIMRPANERTELSSRYVEEVVHSRFFSVEIVPLASVH